ncbi:MAG TPA: sodium-translocating pyrophosphatase [Bacillota bacterium]|jgi:K(+)-stimulated pyrophosphate-energized sodium pump|nr:sodium-translocating pyrophosphatase [Fastidiosipila sp.]HPX93168.1 sodium-translocating pyrophosphatase [Bacillota bacterium]HQB81676.1 sodium-translocating pyrophosphatase [Bacillota bacterium]
MNWAFWPILAMAISLGAFAIGYSFYRSIRKLPSANEEIDRFGNLIRNGAMAFLRTENRVLSRFVLVTAALIILFIPPIWQANSLINNLAMGLCYIFGAVFSGMAGYVGMRVATVANVKTASAAERGLTQAYRAGFRGGAVMGLAIVGSCLLGSSLVYLVFPNNPNFLLAFSFGASSLALFAKAGGGIFTKTADIAADLTGKVELGIPEDDPRNPAVIADNVGDNVGDVAGMGADLFDSNVAAIAAALILALDLDQIPFIFMTSAMGLLASMAGVFVSNVKEKGSPGRALNRGTYFTTGLFFILTLLCSLFFNFEIRLWGAAMVGLLAGTVIGFSSEFFTSDEGRRVKAVARISQQGPAFTILSGFSNGLLSSFPSLIGIGGAALAAYKICEPLGPDYAVFGIALSAVGMLSIIGLITANDAYGPIVDNARGLSEMSGLGEEVLHVTDELDAAGNTAKAITKGFSIGAAGLTVIALLAAYRETLTHLLGTDLLAGFDILDPLVFFGMIVGVGVPAVFSAMLMMGVNRNADRMVKEIHRQFEETPGLKEGKAGVEPDYNRCIDIATVGALKELLPAGLMAIGTTLAVGFIGGVTAIAGYLAGNIMSGVLLALLMSNAGGMWDNAKKYIEAGHYGGKGSEAHKATVIGDTVGDPFKDTAGPSINTQITVVSLVSSLAAGLFAAFSLFG